MTAKSTDALRTSIRAWLHGTKQPGFHVEGALALLSLQGRGELSPSALAVGLALCALADPETGLCRSSLAEVGERVGIARKKSVAGAVEHLARVRFLEVVKTAGKQNQYRIAPGTLSAPTYSEPGAETAPDDEPTVLANEENHGQASI